MISLVAVRPSLQKIITSISSTFDIEVAIFDSQYHLVTCTPNYLEQKGKSVHTPSLEEVLSCGNVLVNKPGHMKSCIGCRFKDHCPATIEILNCIKFQNESIGVIALTSFTKEGHDRLTENENAYLNILTEISDLVAMIALQKHKKDALIHLDKILQLVMDSSKSSLFVIDKDGFVTHCNHSALKLFSFCNLHTNSLYNILPEAIIEEILEGDMISKKYVKNEKFDIFISSSPIKTNHDFVGSVVRIEENKNLKENKKNIRGTDHQFSLDNMKGNSNTIQTLKIKVQKIAKSTSSVLITGETGTGKELLAKAIHYNSNRSDFPLISINCASIPESLFESELFGYEEGAFTGAKKGGKPGRIELAQGGTLFLDEIGEMPLFMQSKLLRVLQERTIERVGGIRSIPIDIRIIAATNQNLEELVSKKEFRADLYYRLNVIPLKLPPLRERKEDIEILAMHFLKKYNLKLDKRLIYFSSDALSSLKTYHWPGNVRELENAVEYAVNMEEENIISRNNLPEKILKSNCINKNELVIRKKIKNIEIEAIQGALDKYGWDVKGKTEAAKELGIGLRTLYRKLKAFEGTHE
ncbi:sigma-54 interaction domain-containing protein [Crassaminicella profunda]|uniref:sigma-54 interaction domain-containing protein n=1 Tax=Crassaminicella profunda TaxID=1286698 RepID=UPI001CA6B2DC|nr:sigma 54-interacting transcriptional regulator [Crassaminicella profunda]QZY57348.1 sigma 54-interacting transcriptional regulator [Crassaminicella profunda]